eukprot:CAMPEP_0172486816 /NCGR_PEP_ID=MMETSP1066-20121228/15552_1 /TAXON_ID=671091 /ORGANISM="Coscinodiscus wailesii, Strain CCMP2513" /LENGTH=51 /DNA_ID=CAMNT_0013253007 /DNA_START=193 /DNA_END=345 /DNA_ORIENTATION=+
MTCKDDENDNNEFPTSPITTKTPRGLHGSITTDNYDKSLPVLQRRYGPPSW